MRKKVVAAKTNGAVSGAAPKFVEHAAAIVPPMEFYVHLDIRHKARVLTHKLPGSPNYLYSVYYGNHERPILELISRPGKDDIIDAIARRKP